MVWALSNLSLAIDLHEAAQHMPQNTAEKMRACADRTDAVFLAIPHDLSREGPGFLTTVDADKLGREPVAAWEYRGYTQTWATGYGGATDASGANICYLRYKQIQRDIYRRLVISAARRYMDQEPDRSFPLYPGTMGDVIWLLLNAHELTGEDSYLARAQHFAHVAQAIFLDDTSPLPRAASHTDHYEAITRADTLMMALLRLWAVEHAPQVRLGLIYTDR